MADSIPLQMLRCRERAVVDQVTGRNAAGESMATRSNGAAHRLHEMGLRAGALVEVLQTGNPCVVRVDGQRLCLRIDDWASVLVRPLPNAPHVEVAAASAPAISIEATA